MANYSLDMFVEQTEDGYRILADWLDEPVSASTFEEAYELAMRARAQFRLSSSS